MEATIGFEKYGVVKRGSKWAIYDTEKKEYVQEYVECYSGLACWFLTSKIGMHVVTELDITIILRDPRKSIASYCQTLGYIMPEYNAGKV